MPDQKLEEYINQRLAEGVSKEEIKKALLKESWQEGDIDEVFSSGIVSDTKGNQGISEQAKITVLPGPVELLNESLLIYKERLRIYAGIALLLWLVNAIFYAVNFTGVFLFGTDAIFILSIISIPFYAVMAFFPMLNLLALTYAVKDRNEQIGIKESYRRALRKLLSYVWISALSGFVVMGSFLLFIIPGIIVSVWFSFAAYILVVEDLKGMDVLFKSREYVRGMWLSVAGRLLFLGTVVFFLLIPIAVLYSLVGRAENAVLSVILNFTISLVLAPVAAPLFVIYGFNIYNKLKTLKGEFSFVPSGRLKAAFIISGLLGLLIIPLFIIVSLLVAIDPAGQLTKAQDMQRTNDLLKIKVSIERYYADNRVFPQALTFLVPDYIDELPVDPKTGVLYEYKSVHEGQNYELCADYQVKPHECFDSVTVPALDGSSGDLSTIPI